MSLTKVDTMNFLRHNILKGKKEERIGTSTPSILLEAICLFQLTCPRRLWININFRHRMTLEELKLKVQLKICEGRSVLLNHYEGVEKFDILRICFLSHALLPDDRNLVQQCIILSGYGNASYF